MKFRYLRDPLFLACVAVYCLGRLWLRQVFPTGFVHSHLNDLLCVPFWVPPMVTMRRVLGLRTHDGPPDALEVLIPLVVWSFVFEWLVPATPALRGHSVADPLDVVCYAAGALGAVLFWHGWYGRQRSGPVSGG